jgi:uncharacterized protein (TIRG00374 family)
MSYRKILLLIFGISIFLLLIFIAGPVKLLDSLLRVHPLLLCSAAAVYMLAWSLRVLRLQIMVHSLHRGEILGVSSAFKANIAAFAINSIFPLKVGDAAMIGFLRKYGVEASKGAAVVVKSRIHDLAAIVVLMMPTVLFYHLDAQLAPRILQTASVIAVFLLMIISVIFAIRGSRVRNLLKRASQSHKYRRIGSVVGKIESASGYFVEMIKAPGIMFLCMLLSLGIWFCEGFIYYLLLIGIESEAKLLPVVAAVMFANVGKGIPGVPGGVGVYEGIAAGFVASFGIPFQSALAAAIIDHLIKKFINLGVGIPAALSMGYSFKRRGE